MTKDVAATSYSMTATGTGGTFNSWQPTGAEQAYSFTHYASVTGTDTYANATNINTPCSITTAFANATAGDVVGIRGGTYSIGPHTGDYEATLKPANSGAAGNPITFAAYTGEVVTLDGTIVGANVWGSNGNVGCNVIGASDVSYVTFDGFNVTTDGGLYMSKVFIGSQSGTTGTPATYLTHNIICKNFDIDGGSGTHSGTDNAEGVRISNAKSVTVENTSIHDFTQTTNYTNTAAVKSYGGADIIIENCNISNCAAGVYPKSYNEDWDIRKNFITSCGTSIEASTNTGYATNIRVSHNIIYDSADKGIMFLASDAAVTGCTAFNNTCYTTQTMTQGSIDFVDNGYSSDGWECYNNIIWGNGSDYGSHTARFDLDGTFDVNDYNMYSGTQRVLTDITHTSLANLQGDNLTGLLSGSHNQNSLYADPTFTNGNGDYSAPSDFALSPATAGTGSDSLGNDMGADVTTIGIQ